MEQVPCIDWRKAKKFVFFTKVIETENEEAKKSG